MATQSSGSVTPTITDRIKGLMELRGITSIGDLARMTGISERSLYRKINQKPGNLTLDDLGEIAQALGAELSVLIAEAA